MNGFGGKKVLVVYDTIARKFFVSLSDLYSSVGHREDYAKTNVGSSTYNRYYKPFYFSTLSKHVFIRISDVVAFVTRYVNSHGHSHKRKSDMKAVSQFVVSSIVPAYKNGKIVKNKKQS